MCILKTMDKARTKATTEEVTIEGEKFKEMLFLLWADESRHIQLFQYTRKPEFLGGYECLETVSVAYALFMRTSRQFCGSILRGGRMDFRGECGCGGIPSIMFTQAGGISDRDGRNSTPGSNLPQVDPVTGRDGNLYSHTW